MYTSRYRHLTERDPRASRINHTHAYRPAIDDEVMLAAVQDRVADASNQNRVVPTVRAAALASVAEGRVGPLASPRCNVEFEAARLELLGTPAVWRLCEPHEAIA